MMRALIQEYLIRVESILLAVLVIVQVTHVYMTAGACQGLILGCAYAGVALGAWWGAWRSCQKHRGLKGEKSGGD